MCVCEQYYHCFNNCGANKINTYTAINDKLYQMHSDSQSLDIGMKIIKYELFKDMRIVFTLFLTRWQ